MTTQQKENQKELERLQKEFKTSIIMTPQQKENQRELEQLQKEFKELKLKRKILFSKKD